MTQAEDNGFDRYFSVREMTARLCEPLLAEDYVIQSMPDVSPPKWHLGHTTWFFEKFVLEPFEPGFVPFDERFGFLFNSYYESVGDRIARDRRGQLSRPTLEEVYRYRRNVDDRIHELLRTGAAGDECSELRARLTLGVHHEEQHQELLLMDIKHILWSNPLWPEYRPQLRISSAANPVLTHLTHQKVGPTVAVIGHRGGGFAFDNEKPAHRVLIEEFELAATPVRNEEYIEFIDDGAYDEPALWLSDGWQTVRERGWQAPLYWENRDGEWWQYTLHGMERVPGDEPVSHVSYYEADAFARWRGTRLPREEEWEVASAGELGGRTFLEDSLAAGRLQPGAAWEWSASAYLPYPGFRPLEGALGEYNGKFMCNQMVLRGGSFATPRAHIRPTYRNFFAPSARWQFSGIRLVGRSSA